MNDSIKDLYGDMEDNSFACYLGHYVFEFPRQFIDPNFKTGNQPYTVCLNVYFAGKTTEELIDYYQLIRKKLESEIIQTGGDLNQLSSTPDRPKKTYTVIANDIDYDAQDILQDSFSIKDSCTVPNNRFELARKIYCHHYSDAVKKIKNVGFHETLEELQDNLLDDLVKANQYGYVKESVKEDTTGMDQYNFWMIPITIYETMPYEDGIGAEVKDYEIYFAAKDKEQTERYEKIIKDKIQKEFNVVIMGGKVIKQDQHGQRASVKVEWPTNCYSVVAGQADFDSQDILQPDYSIREGIKNNYKNNPRLVSFSSVDYRFTSGLYSDLLVEAINVGVYKSEEEFKEHYFEDMVNSAGQEKEVDECCCAGGMGGGVTTASFAPAVTHTVYPKPGKKKSKKEDSDETIADVYSYYGCVVRLSLSFPGSDTKVRKYYVVLGKDLGQIDEFNQKINQNIKQISNDSCILSTTLTSLLYSTEIKDFDFEGQKILDSSLYVNDPKKFISNEKQLDQEEVQIRDIMGRSYDNLADFTNDLFSQMTEDTDDVYWPVRNDETDEFENMIKNARKTKKEKIIARKQRAIDKRDETLFNWLRKMSAEEKYSTIALHDKALKYNAVTDKMRADLDKIKRLPLDSPEFF